MKRVILIGDSIRMGYQSTVQELLGRQAEIWAPQENGGTSANVLAHLDEWVLSRDPDILHLNCGLHDLKTEFGASSQTIAPDQYEENLRQIVDRIVGRGTIQLIWATTTPVNEAWHHARKPFDRFEVDIRTYNDLARRVMTVAGAPINDLYQTMMDAGRDQHLLADGVHFSVEGYALLGRAVVEAIRSHL
jgi:lysophospholipase L1-like esterase